MAQPSVTTIFFSSCSQRSSVKLEGGGTKQPRIYWYLPSFPFVLPPPIYHSTNSCSESAWHLKKYLPDMLADNESQKFPKALNKQANTTPRVTRVNHINVHLYRICLQPVYLNLVKIIVIAKEYCLHYFIFHWISKSNNKISFYFVHNLFQTT